MADLSENGFPVSAADTLGEGEFNRYYMCSVCRLALDNRDETVRAYCAKAAQHPRPESQAFDGRLMPTQALDDLRGSVGVDTALGLPAGPNSGMSVCLTTSRCSTDDGSC